MSKTLGEKSILGAHLALTALLLSLFPSNLSSQIDRTSLTGAIQDSSGRPVPGASVSAIHLGTGLSRAAVSDSQGAYTIADLPAGFYRVTIRKSGFQELTYASIEQAVGATRTLN